MFWRLRPMFLLIAGVHGPLLISGLLSWRSVTSKERCIDLCILCGRFIGFCVNRVPSLLVRIVSSLRAVRLIFTRYYFVRAFLHFCSLAGCVEGGSASSSSMFARLSQL